MNDSNLGNEIAVKIANKIKPYQIKIELFLLVIFLIGLSLIKLNYEVSKILITVSLSTFSMVYFITAFRDEIEIKTQFIRFLNKLINWSYSVATVGILFVIQRWPGGLDMLIVGIFSIVLSTIGLIIMKLKHQKNEKLIEPNFIRSLIIVLFFSWFYLNGDIDELGQLDYQNMNMEKEISNK